MNKSSSAYKKFLIIFIFGMVDLLIGQSRFAIIGDFGDDDAEELAVSNLVKSWNPDFIITTGDNSYDATNIDVNIGKYYHDYIYPYVGSFGEGSPNSTNRFWVSLGNHDYTDGGGLTAHYNYFVLPNNERYYDKVVDNVHLFMVNSYTEEIDGTSSTSIQANWIQTKMLDCLANHSHWRVVAFHHPAYSSGEHQSSIYMRWPFQTWGAHFVVQGHDHDYERLEVNGLTYFVNGTGGRNLRPFGTIHPLSVFRDFAHFGAQLVTISDDSCYVDFIGTDGIRYDRKILTDSALPVELDNFTGRKMQNEILLEWETLTEISNRGFEVLRQVDKNNWDILGFVEGNGNSNAPKKYFFIDKLISWGKYYYRLKQIDTDGNYEFSKVVYVDAGNIPNGFVLEENYPNPFNPLTTIKFAIAMTQEAELKIFDILGNEVAILFNEIAEGGRVYEIKFDGKNLPSGLYLYVLKSEKIFTSKKMLLLK
ncbi:MAG: T9SS type A sorting domain-containing protein [Ignavibacteriales bacterium]